MARSSPTSLRIPTDLNVRIESFAADLNLKSHAAILMLIEQGLGVRPKTARTPSKSASTSFSVPVQAGARLRDPAEPRDRWSAFRTEPKKVKS